MQVESATVKSKKAKKISRALADKKPLLVIKTMELNVLEMADAACVSFNQLMRELKDGRVCSRYTEHWSADLFGFEKHSDTNHKDSDGAYEATEDQQAQLVSVKCLTGNGVKFQNSKDVGAGRKCDTAKLLEAINATHKIMVVDITLMPTVRLIPLDSATVARWVKDGRLGVGGLKKQGFSKLLEESYELIQEAPVDMALWKKMLRQKNAEEAREFYRALALQKTGSAVKNK